MPGPNANASQRIVTVGDAGFSSTSHMDDSLTAEPGIATSCVVHVGDEMNDMTTTTNSAATIPAGQARIARINRRV